MQRGESELHVRVAETLPFSVALGFNNYQSPSIGAERGLITLAHRNLTGHGDILSVTYIRSAGLDLQLDASYTLPLTARDTTLSLRYGKDDTIVAEEPFEALDIQTATDTFGITLRHPFSRTLTQEFALGLTGEHKRSETSLLGEPFSFSLGVEDGEANVTAVRFTPEWIHRTQHQVIVARSRFTVGVDVLDATTHTDSSIPDGRFFAWLGQFQWVRRLPVWDIQTIVRLDVQLADDPLLSVEQIAVGGRFSVRGYRENQLVRDNGLITSLEVRVPLLREKPWADLVQVAPFVDYGRAWNTDLPTPNPRTIASVGVGLRWAVTVPGPFPIRPQLEVY